MWKFFHQREKGVSLLSSKEKEIVCIRGTDMKESLLANPLLCVPAWASCVHVISSKKIPLILFSQLLSLSDHKGIYCTAIDFFQQIFLPSKDSCMQTFNFIRSTVAAFIALKVENSYFNSTRQESSPHLILSP